MGSAPAAGKLLGHSNQPDVLDFLADGQQLLHDVWALACTAAPQQAPKVIKCLRDKDPLLLLKRDGVLKRTKHGLQELQHFLRMKPSSRGTGGPAHRASDHEVQAHTC